ncbi:uncharacterized protein BKCO1_1000611 [Diplodia corticola]|uniref:Uncharacterized protein n=1 Tax=Diplodia corticola TaxID=236234 RepID=A0A1J9RI00_9PEZI|nr:uncharacterized protein BKCO1_1000611 [Diplodia corticola]OJD40264.1 hypothetical protein BKCO1_1000611 [Diplodia corticola]
MDSYEQLEQGSPDRSHTTYREPSHPDQNSAGQSEAAQPLLEGKQPDRSGSPIRSSDHDVVDESSVSDKQESAAYEDERGSIEAFTKEYTGPVTYRPYALRPAFISLLGGSALVLSIAVVILCWVSSTQIGLGTDDGSSALLFGWRFTPSLLAVLYVQLTSMFLDGVKYSEPFARLAKPGGSTGSYTILQKPGAWWNALADGFSKKKNGGSRSWLLICSAWLNIVGFLAISPLSSSFLISKNVPVPREAGFSRMMLSQDSPIPLRTGRETYLRTIGHILQNVSTSAWISDEYTVLPFWPSESETAPLGPLLSTSSQTWQADTTVLNTELDCEAMPLVATGFANDTYPLSFPAHPDEIKMRWQERPSIMLRADSGCTYGLALDPKLDLVVQGGSSWSNVSTFNDRDYGQFKEVYEGDLSQNFYGRLNTSNCGDRELLFTTTVWNGSAGNFSFSPDFRASGNLCTAKYYMAETLVTATLSDSSSIISFDEEKYRESRVPIPEGLLDIYGLQNLTLSPNWTDYIALPDKQSRAAAGGLSVLLAASYDFDTTAMMEDEDFIKNATKIKQRLFGEVLQFSLTQAGSPQETLQGQITVVEPRIVVTLATAIALALLLFHSFCLSLVAWKLSSLQHRPLNLSRNPFTVIGTATLVAHEQQTLKKFRAYPDLSQDSLLHHLHDKKFYTSPNTLHAEPPFTPVAKGKYRIIHQQDEALSNHAGQPNAPYKRIPSSSSSWVPAVIRLRLLMPMFLFLIAIASGILVFYSYSQRSLLYRTAFVFQTNVPGLDRTLPAVSTYSMISTLFGVVVGLWWGAIDVTFRRLQPFLSMKRPMPISKGADLSYQFNYWAWAAWKAASNRHWFLCLVTIGSSLCPVLTISMSALFQRGEAVVHSNTTVQRGLEIRQIPWLFEVNEYIDPDRGDTRAAGVINNLYTKLSTNWMYGAILQAVLNGSQPSWSKDGWSFVPLDISNIASNVHIQDIGNGSYTGNFVPGTFVTVTTPAVRGTIDCNPYDGLDNVSESFTTYKVNVSSDSEDVTTYVPYSGRSTFLQDTTVLSNPSYVACCANVTAEAQGSAAIGYWSQLNQTDNPFQSQTWPIHFATKWIYGNSVTVENDIYPYYTEIPAVQALRCIPAIQTASADVTVDINSGRVKSFTILDEPTDDPNVWTEAFIAHDYGVLFLSSLLAAASLKRLSGSTIGGYGAEDLTDQTFNHRDPSRGLNVDFMTYAMYATATAGSTTNASDASALLDAAAQRALAQTTFATFFQHFASSNVSLADGGWAYQRVNASLPADLLPPVVGAGTEAVNASYAAGMRPASRTERAAAVRVGTPVETLRVDGVAVGLSVGILGFLAAVAVVVGVLRRTYFVRVGGGGFECVGDVLVVVCGSEGLLRLVRDAEGGGEMDGGGEARLGWFRMPDGSLREAVEVTRGGGGARA